MLVSYKWLNEYVKVDDIKPEELAEKITRSGVEVDGLKQLDAGLKGIVVGQVLACEKHPNADKLQKCLVDIGEENPVQIICGAPNVAKGQKVVVAKVGAVLPGNFKIKRTKLRGEESNGMICSLQELGIEGKLVQKEYADGIFVFTEDVEVGADAIPLLNLDDTVFELDLTPNRSDCLSMLGVAYEVAAILGRDVKLPCPEYATTSEKADQAISVHVEAPEENPLYVAKVIRNVKIGPSPLWLQTYLISSGVRPHNNVVDITNYILLEYGQPLHAFDYDRFGSKEIVVRKAEEGEKIVTLDDVERTLKSDQLVITNGREPVALAGVMGGKDSEVQTETTTVLLESAYFNGPIVRKASKHHGLRSEASLRFEKGVDPSRVHEAAERAAQLMVKYADGEVLDGSVEENHLQEKETIISITLDKINKILATKIEMEEVTAIFNRLQFEVYVQGSTISVTVPTRRGDIAIEEDLIEEVARLYGYDRLPKSLPKGEATPGGLTNEQRRRRIVKRYLEGSGLYQAVTYSLTSEEKALQYALEKRKPIKLSMPMSEERSHLRLSIVPQLLDSIAYNLARKNKQVSIYEIGSVFLKTEDNKQPIEQEHVAGAMTGTWVANDWQGETKQVDFYVVKGLLAGLFQQLGWEQSVSYRAVKIEGMHPGRTAEILLDDRVIGFIGQVHPQVEKSLDLEETYVFELLLKPILDTTQQLQYTPIPKYPAIKRDIALVVNKEVTADQLRGIIDKAGGTLLKDIHIFDLYEGEHLGEGKKSIAFSLTYFDPARTLTDEEVVKAHEKVIQAVKEQAGADLRS